jgi:hypothetical protein
MNHRADLTGQVFGKLTVQHHVPGEGTALGILWFCRCRHSPYATCEVWSHNLIAGTITDCGCRQNARMRKRRERARKKRREESKVRVLAKVCALLHVTSELKNIIKKPMKTQIPIECTQNE